MELYGTKHLLWLNTRWLTSSQVWAWSSIWFNSEILLCIVHKKKDSPSDSKDICFKKSVAIVTLLRRGTFFGYLSCLRNYLIFLLLNCVLFAWFPSVHCTPLNVCFNELSLFLRHQKWNALDGYNQALPQMYRPCVILE